jgi:hypothetical protein
MASGVSEHSVRLRWKGFCREESSAAWGRGWLWLRRRVQKDAGVGVWFWAAKSFGPFDSVSAAGAISFELVPGCWIGIQRPPFHKGLARHNLLTRDTN